MFVAFEPQTTNRRRPLRGAIPGPATSKNPLQKANDRTGQWFHLSLQHGQVAVEIICYLHRASNEDVVVEVEEPVRQVGYAVDHRLD